jgi:hypothetical protein
VSCKPVGASAANSVFQWYSVLDLTSGSEILITTPLPSPIDRERASGGA